jgi:hypothetical protein
MPGTVARGFAVSGIPHAPGRWGLLPGRVSAVPLGASHQAPQARGCFLTEFSSLLDPQEGSCDRTLFEPEERKKDQLWQLSAHCPRVFGHHEHLAALV